MPEIFFTVKGAPTGKGRPRITRSGHCYTPQKTREYESKVILAARHAMRNYDASTQPCEVHIHAFGGIAPSWSWSKKGKYYSLPWTGKPDCDNIAKAILDACNGVLFLDDSQVYRLEVVKTYDDDQRVEVHCRWDD